MIYGKIEDVAFVEKGATGNISGKGNTSPSLALRNVFDCKGSGVVRFSEESKIEKERTEEKKIKIDLAKNSDGEWKVIIDHDSFNITGAKIDGEESSVGEAISKFTETKKHLEYCDSALILSEREKDILEIVRRDGEISIKFDQKEE